MSAQQGWAPEAPPSVDSRHGVGVRLRQAREARGLTFDVIASQTKIPPHHLQAIETGTSALPAFYQRAEIRAFARAVGVDERLALSQFETITAPAGSPAEAPVPERAQPAPVRPAKMRSHLHSVLALLIAALTGAVLARTVFPPTIESAGPVTSAAAPAASAHMSAPAVEPIGVSETATTSSTGTAAVSAEQGTPVVEPPKTDGPAELVITSQPAGARVTVNGIGWGVTPLTIRHLPPGDKRIRVTKDGYAASERALAVGEGSRRAVNVQLTTLR